MGSEGFKSHILLGINRQPPTHNPGLNLKEIIIALPPPLLHPHELTLFDNLDTIDYQGGWNGRPIAVAGLYDDEFYHQCQTGIHLDCRDAPPLMIIDGQTRWTRLRFDQIPVAVVQIFPLAKLGGYLSTWKEGGYRTHSIEQVRRAAQTRCQLPEKATRFQVPHTTDDGEKGLDRIMLVQPQLKISRQALDYDIPHYWDLLLGL